MEEDPPVEVEQSAEGADEEEAEGGEGDEAEGGESKETEAEVPEGNAETQMDVKPEAVQQDEQQGIELSCCVDQYSYTV